jgi:hypothetical protein
MKRKPLQQHKETTLVCEEGIFEIEAINNMLVPHTNKTMLAQNLQTILEKTRMYCTICHKTNDIVETCRVERKEDLIPTIFKTITQKIKKHVKYSCRICVDTRHKIIDCPKYNDMQNMFKNKGVKPIDKQVVVEPKVSNPSVHMVDVNMAIIRNNVIEK